MKLIGKWESLSENRRFWIIVLAFVVVLGILPRLNLPTPIPFPSQYPLKNGSYEQGAKAYKSGNYGLALANFIYAASHKSDVRAMSMASRMYVHGHGVKRDICQGVYWADMAARKGDFLDQLRLSQAYYFSYALKQDDEKAYLWARAAVENKDTAYTIKWYKKIMGETLKIPVKWYQYIKDSYDKKQIAIYDKKFANWSYKNAAPANIIRIHRLPYIGMSGIAQCSEDILH